MRLLTIFLLSLLAIFNICAQEGIAPNASQADSLSSDDNDWRVSLLTCAPGREIYELEGHTGLRLQSPSRGVDMVVNWGVFDFASPGFVYRFVKGETDYMAGAAPTRLFVDAYRAEGRAVAERTINLTPAEAERVVALVADNLRPENRVYRYNYVADNCATRPLAIIERAIGDTIALGRPDSTIVGARTFRQAMRAYHRNYPWYQFGIDLALGVPIDRHVAPRAMSFSPIALDRMIGEGSIGPSRPAAAPAVMLTSGAAEGIASGPTPWYLTPLAFSLIVLLLTIILTIYDIRRRRLSRLFDTILFLAFALAGGVITFLVFFSVHEAASPNWLLLWLNPLCLIPVIFVWTKGGRRLLIWYGICNFVAMLALGVVWISGIQAFNIAFIPLIISDGIRSLFFIFNPLRCLPTVFAQPTPAVRLRRPTR